MNPAAKPLDQPARIAVDMAQMATSIAVQPPYFAFSSLYTLPDEWDIYGETTRSTWPDTVDTGQHWSAVNRLEQTHEMELASHRSGSRSSGRSCFSNWTDTASGTRRRSPRPTTTWPFHHHMVADSQGNGDLAD